MSSVTVRYVRPYCYPLQEQAIFGDNRFGIIFGSTKSGKTFSSIVWLVEQALLNGGKDKHFHWIAPSIKQSKMAYRRLKYAIPKETFTANETERTITLFNGAVIGFLTGDDPDGIYGADCYAAVLDEASRMKEAAWHAVRSTLTATNGPARIIGNVRTRTDWFYKLGLRAKEGELGDAWRWFSLTCDDAVNAGVVKREEIDEAQRTLPHEVFRALYYNEPSEMGLSPFGLSHILNACMITHASGHREPRQLSAEPPVCYGVDLGRQVDYTVVIGLDASGAVSQFLRWKDLPWDETMDRIMATVGSVPTLVDETGIGDSAAAIMKKLKKNIQGFRYNKQSRQDLLEGLAIGIQSGRVRFPDGIIRQELEAFEFSVLPSGSIKYVSLAPHDDTTHALALAYRLHAKPKPVMSVEFI